MANCGPILINAIAKPPETNAPMIANSFFIVMVKLCVYIKILKYKGNICHSNNLIAFVYVVCIKVGSNFEYLGIYNMLDRR